MKILNIRALRGPNYWSIHRQQLIVMELDLEDLEEMPTNLIPGFSERIQTLLPSLYTHECSEGKLGGFFERVKDGTWMGHVIEHIALEVQTLAGMNCGFGRTRGTGRPGCYNVVFSYEVEEAGRYVAAAAVRIAEALVKGGAYDLQQDIDQLRLIAEDKKLGPSTAAIVAEAQQRGIPAIRLDDGAYVQLGHGAKLKKIEAAIASTTGLIAVELVGDKHRTKQVLKDNFVPVPYGVIIRDEQELAAAAEQVGFPLVIKPLDGNQGKGATTNIRSLSCAGQAFKRAKAYSEKIIVENFITGNDFRALMINYRLVAAAMRVPASVTGDGLHTIEQLIQEANNDPRRGNGHCNMLTKIKVDDDTLTLLKEAGFTLQTVLPQGQNLRLKTTANLSTGGSAEDVTDSVHPANVALFERIARIIGLDICGIDVIASGLSIPLSKSGGAVIEVNAAPGLRMHLEPTIGRPRNVAAPIIDMLFPDSNGRIPLIAVTGTNGKTTTTRLIAHIMQEEGYATGITTTDGIYLNNKLVYKGDCSGPFSARAVLGDPAVELAVLECARGGILRSGLGFDSCNCAVVTNIAEDHLGLGGINTIDQLTRVKSVVPESVMKSGYAVLNADDDLVYAMREKLSCKVALFSLYSDNVRIQQHCKAGGVAAVCEEGYIIIQEHNTMTIIDKIENIPITFGGKAKFNIANVLGAVLAAYTTGVKAAVIRNALGRFRHSAEETPGRMNLFEFGQFSLIVDYAHNPHSLRAFGEYVKALPATKKVGVITAVGDRRGEDIIAMGEEAARIFDEIIIRMDADLRGRTELEIGSLLKSGIQKTDPGKKISYFFNEPDAVRHAVDTAVPQSFTAVFADDIESVIDYIKQQQERYNQAHLPVKEAI